MFARLKSELKSELHTARDFYLPQGAPKTYLNGDPMDPADARAWMWLSVVITTLSMLIATTIVYLVIAYITGS